MKYAEQNFELETDFIELYKLLKVECLATSGGEAKIMIANGHVNVNGALELRKRKKLVSGDIVAVAQVKIHIRSGRN